MDMLAKIKEDGTNETYNVRKHDEMNIELRKLNSALQHLQNKTRWQRNLSRTIRYLEPVCCKKHTKKVPDQLLVCEVGDL